MDEVELPLLRARFVFAMTRNGAASRSSSQENFVRRDTIEAMKRSGVADLPLHGGRVPQWQATRKTTLGKRICESEVQK